MTVAEFKTEFLERYDYQSSSRAPGVDDYSISMYLTRAQEDLVYGYFDEDLNRRKKGFEADETVRRKLASLIRPTSILYTSGSTEANNLVHPNSRIYDLSSYDILRIVYEEIKLTTPTSCGDTTATIIPVRHDEINVFKRSKYRKPSTSTGWRLDREDKKVEIVYPSSYESYYLRFVKRPNPIIVADLTSLNQSINGFVTTQTIETPDMIHPKIVELAVIRALEVVADQRFQSSLILEQRSE